MAGVDCCCGLQLSSFAVFVVFGRAGFPFWLVLLATFGGFGIAGGLLAGRHWAV